MVGIAGLHVQQGKRRHVGIVGLAVVEGFQGQRIGRRLMDTLPELADNWLGLVRLELEVFAENTCALRLYESLGFETEGRQRQRIFRAGRSAIRSSWGASDHHDAAPPLALNRSA